MPARHYRLRGEFVNITRGTGLMSHVFDTYAPVKGGFSSAAMACWCPPDGPAVAYALWKLQDRGRMFVSPGEMLYEGMVIGIHSRDNDLVVNPIRATAHQRARVGHDEAVRLVPRSCSRSSTRSIHRRRRLVEVTPQSIHP